MRTGPSAQIETGVRWGGQDGPRLTDHHPELSDDWQVIAFMVSGRLGTHRGSGTLTYLLPGLTANEQEAKVCTVGELTWSVARTAGKGSQFGRPSLVHRLDDERTVAMGLRQGEYRWLCPLSRLPCLTCRFTLERGPRW